MYCPSCGKSVEEQENFCPFCGKPLHNNTSSPVQRPLSQTFRTSSMPQAVQKKKSNPIKTIAIVIGVVFIVAIIIVGVSLQSPPSTQSNNSGATPAPTNIVSKSTPKPSSPYVEIDYSTNDLGWYQGTPDSNGFNYTYLVLNVTITNHGYSQVNPSIGDFSITVNGQSYSEDYYDYYPFITGSLPFDTSFSGRGSPWLWATYSSPELANTGSISGWIIFKFGDPNVIPQQPELINLPFSLSCSVDYGTSFPYLPAETVINHTA